MVALALVLTLNPLLLYFSRFFRSDVPLATFMLVALGCGLRAAATGRTRYVYAGSAALACGFAAKENAILYPVAWAGAAGVVGLFVLWQATAPRERLAGWLRRGVGGARSFAPALGLASVEFLALLVVLYAPRAGEDGVGFWTMFDRPAVAPEVVAQALVGSAEKLVSTWVTGGHHSHPYAPFLGHYLAVLAVTALPTIALAGYGIRTSRGAARGRLAAFGGWWGLASVVGYPYATDIKAPWLAVHAVVAFAVPAALGLAALYQRGKKSLGRQDSRTVRRVALVCLLMGGQVAGVAVLTSYTHPPLEANFVAQGAQPGGDLRPVLGEVERIAERNQGEDVLYYGRFATKNEQVNAAPPAGPGWYRRLPFSWYTAAYGANVTNARAASGIGPNPPPVVIAPAPAREELAGRLDGYVAREYAMTRIGEVRTYSVFGYEYTYEGKSVVFFVDRSALRRQDI